MRALKRLVERFARWRAYRISYGIWGEPAFVRRPAVSFLLVVAFGIEPPIEVFFSSSLPCGSADQQS
jgi:hypothetical protein